MRIDAAGWALPAGATDQANAMHLTWSVFGAAALAVAVLVWFLILLPAFVWRKRGERLPPQFRQNPALEITWTVIPLIVVALLFWLTVRAEGVVDHLNAHPDALVDVTAFRWSWRFDYPGTGVAIVGTPERPPQMVLPLGETTQVNLRSVDVNHAFWVPAFLFKRDAIPGVLNRFDLTPHTAGVYRGECGEFCGLDHALMTFTVRVVPPEQYRSWLARRGRGA